jgi:hypothetical protein
MFGSISLSDVRNVIQEVTVISSAVPCFHIGDLELGMEWIISPGSGQGT